MGYRVGDIVERPDWESGHKAGDIVRLIDFPEDHVNARGRIKAVRWMKVDNEMPFVPLYFVSNMNMPFQGTLAYEPFTVFEVESEEK